ncbi:MAG: MinD/ParA family protein [Desulfamplus sp.]|nr:MinD/ParA family protein [Desulfamplus sp.]MBF0241545.1 MinD/ParA family protein [Desulfamplus sp.]MBF0389575.1 MinD/ParA family protein [Desulfamplus sp.]
MASGGSRRVPRVISVTSGKGGVGKTNTVGNLAIALNALGKRVVIVDADVGLANIDIIFNLRPKYNISHVISGERTLHEVMVKTHHGVNIIAGGSGFANLTQLTHGERLNLLTEFETLENMADIILLDTGAGISSNVLYFNAAADECIVIATREPTSITDAYALMKVMSQEYGTKYFKLLVNVVSSKQDAKNVYATLDTAIGRFLKNVVLEYLGNIPSDPKLQKAVLNRSTVMDYAPESPSSRAFEEIAKKIVDSPIRLSSDGNIKFFMKKVLDSVN